MPFVNVWCCQPFAPDRKTVLADMAARIRNLKGFGLNEGVSTRLLVYAAKFVGAGLSPAAAARVAIENVLTDDADVAASVRDIIDLYFAPAEEPETARPPAHAGNASSDT